MSLEKKRVCVIVLGDIGRSPRMQYHVKSLIRNNYFVDLIGNLETSPLEEITSSENVKIHELNSFPHLELPNLVKYLIKTIWQFLTLLMALSSIAKPHFLLCQNPPAIPTLIVCYLYCWLQKTKFIIDWHNYTYTILALNSSQTSIIVRITKWIESFFGRTSSGNLCVTNAMKEDLFKKWAIRATVLYDRPPEQFRPITLSDRHDLFMKLSKTFSEFLPKSSNDFKESGVLESTSFTQKLSNGNVIYKKVRPGLVVSSTSWTPDEDFGILLKSLDEYEKRVNDSEQSLPDLVCVITGKGPLKKHYSNLLKTKNWNHVSVSMPWLESQDYPKLLASADLGVCLHWSSSGLDLPMKVVDMFGCGLPVCAINFKCLNELVQHKNNGFIFNNSEELLDYLTYWFKDFPNNNEKADLKENFAINLKEFQKLRWDDNWDQNAWPLFK